MTIVLLGNLAIVLLLAPNTVGYLYSKVEVVPDIRQADAIVLLSSWSFDEIGDSILETEHLVVGEQLGCVQRLEPSRERLDLRGRDDFLRRQLLPQLLRLLPLFLELRFQAVAFPLHVLTLFAH